MIIIHPGFLLRFNTLLVEKSIPGNHHNHCRKWLKYYLDFCKKYRLPESQQESLPHFIKKLQGKNQTKEQQKQASNAVSLYYELVKSGTKIANEDSRPHANRVSSGKGLSWNYKEQP